MFATCLKKIGWTDDYSHSGSARLHQYSLEKIFGYNTIQLTFGVVVTITLKLRYCISTSKTPGTSQPKFMLVMR